MTSTETERLRADLRLARARLGHVAHLAEELRAAADRMEAPEGFTSHVDVGTAAAAIYRALGTAP
jgi:predicted amidohydrolase